MYIYTLCKKSWLFVTTQLSKIIINVGKSLEQHFVQNRWSCRIRAFYTEIFVQIIIIVVVVVVVVNNNNINNTLILLVTQF